MWHRISNILWTDGPNVLNRQTSKQRCTLQHDAYITPRGPANISASKQGQSLYAFLLWKANEFVLAFATGRWTNPHLPPLSAGQRRTPHSPPLLDGRQRIPHSTSCWLGCCKYPIKCPTNKHLVNKCPKGECPPTNNSPEEAWEDPSTNALSMNALEVSAPKAKPLRQVPPGGGVDRLRSNTSSKIKK